MSTEPDEGPEDLSEEDSVTEQEKMRPFHASGKAYSAGNPGGWGKSKFKQEFIRDAMIAARAGMTHNEIADLLNISPSGLMLWQYQYPELKAAIKEGRELWDDRVEASFAHAAVGYSHKAEKIFMTKDGEIVRAEYIKQYPPNHQAAAIWLSNRRPDKWSIRRNGEESNGSENKLTVEIVGYPGPLKMHEKDSQDRSTDAASGSTNGLPTTEET